jgi:Arc/MetJ-type ribon-helix-helix transcriptional regulator
MAKSKVAICLDKSTLARLDQLVKRRIFPSRSQAIEEAVTEKLGRLERNLSTRGSSATGSRNRFGLSDEKGRNQSTMRGVRLARSFVATNL